ncbi:class I SAM-dependent methyltransferase [Planotetraspora sp. A-T 1434]|uniref:class I SAM-dependent methyltransferase n=1 Tax=Planotetraspora sp. A-T 1434 TaxID=2979219 RepID=UPI0021BE462A|nr:class I SAM-dependent methyltransferase [Planotetraspora sp. A-T 1434]MCT9929135.1 class I SAM-dependent methyltransferase [Planotetraspora sp. A-T 1434]
MARIDYNGPVAAAYESGRGAPEGGLDNWRSALAPYFPASGPLLDLGAGTGLYARAISDWFGQRVIAVEPSMSMLRQAIAHAGPDQAPISYVAGRAEEIPLADGRCAGAWLSTMIHHVTDLAGCARELRRVTHAGAPVLIRGTYPGRQSKIALYRFFPTAARIVDSFPSVEFVIEAFSRAGYSAESFSSVRQSNARDLREFYEKVRHRANTTLLKLPDDEFAAGLERLRQAAESEVVGAPVESELELLVLR